MGRGSAWAALCLGAVAFSAMPAAPALAGDPVFRQEAVGHYPDAVPTAAVAGSVETFRTGFFNASEPTVGIAADGTIFADDQVQVVASTSGGRTWSDISPPLHTPTSLDPYLYFDVRAHRLFKSDLLGTCQQISYSDDRGASWTTVVGACNLSDHQTIAAGPPVSSPTVGFPDVVYNCSQSGGYNGYSTASVCDKSLDGGLTWVPTGSPAFEDPSPYGVGAGSGDSGIPAYCNGDIGHIFVGADGALYVPRGWCGQPWLAVSRDEGLTWTRVQVGSNGMNTTTSGGFGVVAPNSGQSDHEAAVVADDAGNVFFMWMALDRRPYLAVSRDHGGAWSRPLMVAPPGVGEAWGPALAIAPGGQVAMAYMGSVNSPGPPWTGDYGRTTFAGYLALVPAPLEARPLVLSAPIVPSAHPLVRGACGPDRCAAEFDFIDVEFSPAGGVWGVFIDGSNRAELLAAHLSQYRSSPFAPPSPAVPQAISGPPAPRLPATRVPGGVPWLGLALGAAVAGALVRGVTARWPSTV